LILNALCYGDVDASYIVPWKNCTYSAVSSQEIPVIIDDNVARIPVFVDRSFYGGAMSLVFRVPELSDFVMDVSVNGVGKGDFVWALDTNKKEIRIAWYDIHGKWFDASDPLVMIHCEKSVLDIDVRYTLNTGIETYISGPEGEVIDQLEFLIASGRMNSGNNTGISVYPVPADNRILVSADVNAGERLSASFFQIDGRINNDYTFYANLTGRNIFEINTSLFPEGVYFCKIQSNNSVFGIKTVIIHNRIFHSINTYK